MGIHWHIYFAINAPLYYALIFVLPAHATTPSGKSVCMMLHCMPWLTQILEQQEASWMGCKTVKFVLVNTCDNAKQQVRIPYFTILTGSQRVSPLHLSVHLQCCV